MRHTNYPIIGLSGYKGSGKDTVASHLVKMYDFERRAFADKLKEAVAALWDIDVQDVDDFKNISELRCGIFNPTRKDNQHSNHYTYRQFLQRFGTEMGRNVFGSDFWVNLAMSKPYTRATVFSDARFGNEQRAIKAIGGKIVWVERPGYDSDGHVSEQKPPLGSIDYVLHNNVGHFELFEKIDVMMGNLYNMEPVH